MSAPWNKWDWDYLWHDLGGMGITMAVVALLMWTGIPWGLAGFCIPILVGAGLLREGRQHDWPDILTPHQWLEGVLWGVGSAQGVLLAWLLESELLSLVG